MTKRLCLIFGVVLFSACVTGLHLTNLGQECMKCICEGATGCDLTNGCNQGYCGPFGISRLYWIDADKPVLPQDDPERGEAYQDCATNYNCAKLTVERYMAKYGKDCNGDNITSCEDYFYVHYNGGNICNKTLKNNGYYTRFLLCFEAQTGLI